MEISLLELLRLPDVPHVIYEHPPLVLALCQVQFAPVLSVTNPVFIAPFQEAIREQYPVLNQTVPVQIELVAGLGEGGIRGQAQTPQWRFTDASDDWTIVLTQNFLTIETRAYEDFGDFLIRLRKILEALVQHVKPAFVTRLGLRYIDEIRQGELEWASIIRRELLGPLAVPELAHNSNLALQEVVLRYSHGRGINIHHGLLPDGSTVTPRPGHTPPEGPFYLLDFDVFREFHASSQQPMVPEVICKHVAEYNKAIYRLFRWSVMEEYLSTLEERSYDAD